MENNKYNEENNSLEQTARLLSKVSGKSYDESLQSLTTVMNAFNLDESISEDIIDQFAKLDTVNPVSPETIRYAIEMCNNTKA